MSKFLKILLGCLLVLSALALVAFYVQNTTGIYAISNLSEAMSTTGMLDAMLIWACVLLFAAILLVVILSVINMAGNKKSLKKTGFTLLLAIVLVGVSYFCASGDPVAVNLAVPPTEAALKMTDTLLILCYILLGCSFVALIWGGIRKLIHTR